MKKPIYKFELIGGSHTEGTNIDGTFVEYKKGDIIITPIDLASKFGGKFRRITKKNEVTKEEDSLIEEEFILMLKEPVISKDIEVDCIGKYRLSILICSIIGREKELSRLLEDLEKQKTEQVEILVEVDNEKMSIGPKRNSLLKKAEGDYIAFIDDDDEVSVNYVVKILEALKTNPDCCGIEGFLIRPGHKYKFIHSIRYDTWFSKNDIYYRCPNHLNPVRRELALQVGFPEKDYGEDQDYSLSLFPLLKTEVYIQGVLYYYVKTKGTWKR